MSAERIAQLRANITNVIRDLRRGIGGDVVRTLEDILRLDDIDAKLAPKPAHKPKLASDLYDRGFRVEPVEGWAFAQRIVRIADDTAFGIVDPFEARSWLDGDPAVDVDGKPLPRISPEPSSCF